jgi:hypothetical protein
VISEIKKEMYEKEEIPLIVTEEQMDTLFSLFGYYGWYADEVNGTLGTHLNGFTVTDDIIESKRDTGEEDHHPNSEECSFCLRKPCITDGNNGQL